MFNIFHNLYNDGDIVKKIEKTKLDHFNNQETSCTKFQCRSVKKSYRRHLCGLFCQASQGDQSTVSEVENHHQAKVCKAFHGNVLTIGKSSGKVKLHFIFSEGFEYPIYHIYAC